MEQILWVEKYRPRTIEECILPNNIKEAFSEYVKRKEIPNLLLTGPAGVGKTTVAKALCEEVGCDYLIINGSDENGIDTFRNKIKNYATTLSLTGGRKVIIIDEADYLNPNSIQPALRSAMEEYSINCSFIFTCNYKNRIIAPLHSRCTVVDFKIPNSLKPKLASEFFKRVQDILAKENVSYNRDVVMNFIVKFFPDNRRILNELQRTAIKGSIEADALSHLNVANINELIAAIKEKNFVRARKWVVNNLDNDSVTMMRQIYDSLSEKIKPECIPPAILILGKYQYQAAFVADQEINIMACIVELMMECDFK